MRALNQKKLTTVFSVAAFVLLLLLGIVFSSYYILQNDSNLVRSTSQILVRHREVTYFQDGETYSELPAGEYTFTVENQGKLDSDLQLIFSQNCTFEQTFYEAYTPISVQIPHESRTHFAYSCEEIADFGFVEVGQNEFSFVFDGESFAVAQELCDSLSDIVFIKATEMDTMRLEKPLRIFGDYTFREFFVSSHEEGRIVVAPDREFQAKFFAYCPAVQLYTYRVTPSTDAAVQDYYFKVKSFNGKAVDLASYPVADFEMLVALSENSYFLSDPQDVKVSFVAPIVFEDNVHWNRVCNLEVLAQPEMGEFVLSMRSLSEVALQLTLADGVELAAENLYYHAPFCDLTWESASPIPILERVEGTQNLRSFNGQACRLGGLGEGEVTLKLAAGSVPGLEEDILLERKGNLLTAAFPYDITMSALSAVQPEILSENRCYFEETNEDGSVDFSASPILVLQDDNGNLLRLKVKILRETKNLPVIYLETEDGAEVKSKEQYISATFVLDAGTSGFESIPLSHIRLRGRGNSTWNWDKKPYKIHFDTPVSVFGLTAGEEWALLANYADKSLMRNHVAQLMAAQLSFDYAPTQNAVDVFLNGDYIGVYSFGEHLEEGEGRVEITHDMKKVDCGYFLEVGGVVSGVDVQGMNYFHAGLLKFVLVKGPEFNSLTSAQFDYIKTYLKEANDAVVAGKGYEEYIDMESLIDWLIMIELTNNTDCAFRRSCYFTKDSGGKLKLGPVWDFDLAFGNFSRDVQDYSTWASYNMDDDYVGETWSYYLFRDPKFQKQFKARWDEVRDLLLDTAFEAIDAEYERIAPSAADNFRVWDILGKKVAFERRDTNLYPTYDSQIRYLKTFLKNRAAWIDKTTASWKIETTDMES